MLHTNENMAVALLSERLAIACGYDPDMAKLIMWAAFHHDIGKLLITPNLLNKPGKLSAHEFQEVKMHTKYGEMLLSSVPGEKGEVARQVALLHHEWHNGQGYWGYSSSQIPVYVSIVAVCDVFVALVTKRAYKSAWDVRSALGYIENLSGTQFCPLVVGVFVGLVGGAWEKSLNKVCPMLKY